LEACLALLPIDNVLVYLLNLRLVELHLHTVIQVINHLLLGIIEVLRLTVLRTVDLLKISIIFVEIGVQELLVLCGVTGLLSPVLSAALTPLFAFDRLFCLVEGCCVNHSLWTLTTCSNRGILIISRLTSYLLSF